MTLRTNGTAPTFPSPTDLPHSITGSTVPRRLAWRLTLPVIAMLLADWWLAATAREGLIAFALSVALQALLVAGVLVWMVWVTCRVVKQTNEERLQTEAAKGKRMLSELAISHDTQRTLNELLRLSLAPLTLSELLQRALELILAHLWLPKSSDGSIFLVEDEPGILVLRTKESPCQPCKRVPFGECMCGLAAAGGKIEFSAEVDERHTRRFEGMAPHGHYIVPLISDGKSMGVLVIRLPAGRQRDEREVASLEAVAHTLAGLIRRKRTEARLQEYQERLRALTAQIVQVQEEERRRFALSLHDSLGQNMALCRIKLDRLRLRDMQPEMRQSIDDVLALLSQTIQEARSLTFELSPPALYELGLGPAIEQLTRNIQKQSGVVCTYIEEGDAKPMDEVGCVLLFHAVREALVNMAKHARAQHATIRLEHTDDSVQVSVADDGIGFDTAELLAGKDANKGFGLFNIRERVERLGGRVKIASAPGKGTTISLNLPLAGFSAQGVR